MKLRPGLVKRRTECRTVPFDWETSDLRAPGINASRLQLSAARHDARRREPVDGLTPGAIPPPGAWLPSGGSLPEEYAGHFCKEIGVQCHASSGKCWTAQECSSKSRSKGLRKKPDAN